jgi:hypothetical protein
VDTGGKSTLAVSFVIPDGSENTVVENHHDLVWILKLLACPASFATVSASTTSRFLGIPPHKTAAVYSDVDNVTITDHTQKRENRINQI